MAAIAMSAASKSHRFVARDFANIAWAFAVLVLPGRPLLRAAAAEMPLKLPEGDSQAISNSAWALTTLLYHGGPAMSAISAAALAHMNEFDEQGCSTMAFAFAALGPEHEPLLNAIATQGLAVWGRGERVPQFRHLLDTLGGGQKRGMKDVIQHIEDIHDVLDKEQASDKERQRYCETKLRRAEMTKKDKERDAEDATSIIATFQNELDTVIAEINTLEGRMKDLDAQVADATQARQAERAAFEKSRETNSAALELMEVAQKRIQRFYAASFLQEQENATESARLASPPEADLSYRAQGGASQVMLLFGKIKADIQKQTMMLQSDDEVGQSEYENLVKNSNEKKMADNKSLGGKQAARAELEVDLQQGRAELRSTQQLLKALAEETRNLHAECDFLLKNFDLREDARRSERRSLTRAKSVLEAADA
ncbi:unnamed protein product [Effrenium voratum]|nr:unnamed protein product [Effrenium voratum]